MTTLFDWIDRMPLARFFVLFIALYVVLVVLISLLVRLRAQRRERRIGRAPLPDPRVVSIARPGKTLEGKTLSTRRLDRGA